MFFFGLIYKSYMYMMYTSHDVHVTWCTRHWTCKSEPAVARRRLTSVCYRYHPHSPPPHTHTSLFNAVCRACTPECVCVCGLLLIVFVMLWVWVLTCCSSPHRKEELSKGRFLRWRRNLRYRAHTDKHTHTNTLFKFKSTWSLSHTFLGFWKERCVYSRVTMML